MQSNIIKFMTLYSISWAFGLYLYFILKKIPINYFLLMDDLYTYYFNYN